MPPKDPAREATNRFAENVRGVAESMREQIAEVRREIDKQVIADHPDLDGFCADLRDRGSGE